MAAQTPSVKVRLFAKAAELAGSTDVELVLKEPTIKGMLSEIASSQPLLTDHIVRADGSPRSSTKILIDGHPPASLDTPIPLGANVVISIVHPCDG